MLLLLMLLLLLLLFSNTTEACCCNKSDSDHLGRSLQHYLRCYKEKSQFRRRLEEKKKKKTTFFTNDRSGRSGRLWQKNAFIYSFGILLPLRALCLSLSLPHFLSLSRSLPGSKTTGSRSRLSFFSSEESGLNKRGKIPPPLFPHPLAKGQSQNGWFG